MQAGVLAQLCSQYAPRHEAPVGQSTRTQRSALPGTPSSQSLSARHALTSGTQMPPLTQSTSPVAPVGSLVQIAISQCSPVTQSASPAQLRLLLGGVQKPPTTQGGQEPLRLSQAGHTPPVISQAQPAGQSAAPLQVPVGGGTHTPLATQGMAGQGAPVSHTGHEASNWQIKPEGHSASTVQNPVGTHTAPP